MVSRVITKIVLHSRALCLISFDINIAPDHPIKNNKYGMTEYTGSQ